MEEEVSKLPEFDYKSINFEAESFTDLSEHERKILVQRFIDLIIYDSEKFKTAMKLLHKWENQSTNPINE